MTMLFLIAAFLSQASYAFDTHVLDGQYENEAEFYRIPSKPYDILPATASETQKLNAVNYPALSTATLKKLKRTGTWAFKFVLIRNDGSEQIISEYRSDALMKPASTLKLFTAWMGFSKNESKSELEAMLKKSDNYAAATMLDTLGGKKQMIHFYRENEILTGNEFKILDGNGYSHSNRLSVESEIKLLTSIYQSNEYPRFKELMAQPGQVGTLKKRFNDLSTPIYAKTGTLYDTTALAGYAETEQGTLIFSVIVNALKPMMVQTKDALGRETQANVASSNAHPAVNSLLLDHITFSATCATLAECPIQK